MFLKTNTDKSQSAFLKSALFGYSELFLSDTYSYNTYVEMYEISRTHMNTNVNRFSTFFFTLRVKYWNN